MCPDPIDGALGEKAALGEAEHPGGLMDDSASSPGA